MVIVLQQWRAAKFECDLGDVSIRTLANVVSGKPGQQSYEMGLMCVMTSVLWATYRVNLWLIHPESMVLVKAKYGPQKSTDMGHI